MVLPSYLVVFFLLLFFKSLWVLGAPNRHPSPTSGPENYPRSVPNGYNKLKGFTNKHYKLHGERKVAFWEAKRICWAEGAELPRLKDKREHGAFAELRGEY